MSKSAVGVVLSIAALALLAVPSLAKLETAQMTTAAAIEDAFNRGALDRDQMILQKAYALYAPEKVSVDLVGGLTDKCGSPLADEIRLALPDLSQPVADEIRGLRARPTGLNDYIETTHFRIHYTTGGTNAILSTSYRDAIATAAENVWDHEVTSMGFRAPPPDGSDPDGGGGNDLYDIYVMDLGAGLYGYCQGTYYYSGGDYPPNAANSYVVIDNNYPYSQFGYPNPVDPMKVTVAHEFNHACQAAHDINESTWYKEASSTCVEDMVYDGINDYCNYLPYILNYMYVSLDANPSPGMHWYGACIWNHFLCERFGNQILVDNWYQMESSGQTIDMINVVLNTYGSSFEEAYKEFAVWCWFTGSRDDGNHFHEGGTWCTASIMRGHNSYPIAIGGPTPGWEPDSYGCNYIQLNNPGGDYDGLLVSYDGPSLLSTGNAAFLNYRSSSGSFGEYGEIPLNPWGIGELTVDGWDSKQYLGLVVINTDRAANDMSYTYNAEQVQTGVDEEQTAFGLRPASPNPFAETTSISYSVPAGGGLVDIVVYDVNGREVRKLVHERLDGGTRMAVWDGMDNSGERVASGVYFTKLIVLK
jgi:hypothetical protein